MLSNNRDAFYQRLFWLCLIGLTGFRLFYLSAIPLTGDEAYHWEWSRHLAFGYYDHPPLVAWMIAFFTWIGGSTLFWVRLTALLCITGTTYLTYRLGREIGGPIVGATAGLFSLAATAMNLGAAIVTTDSPVIFFWMLTIFLVWRALDSERGAYWYWAGASLGLGLLSKFLILPLAVGILLFLICSKADRSWLRRKEPYLGICLALVIFAPFIIWNSQHGWTSFVFHFTRHQEAIDFKRPLIFLAWQMFLVFSPVMYGGVVWSLVRQIKQVTGQPAALGAVSSSRFAWLFLCTGWLFPVFLFFDSIRNTTSAHWAMAAYGVILVGLALEIQRRWQELRQRRKKPILGVLILITAFIWSGAVVTLTLNPDLIGKLSHQGNSINEAYGWAEIGQAISNVNHQTAGKYILATSSYSLSSMLSFYTPGQPYISMLGPGSKHGRAYDLWDKWSEWTGREVLFISEDNPAVPDSRANQILKTSFNSWELLKEVPVKRNGREIRRFYFTIGHSLKPDPYATVREKYRW